MGSSRPWCIPRSRVRTLPPVVPAVSAFPIPSASTRWGGSKFRGNPVGNLPKLRFPQLDGHNPRLWLSSAEDYLELYSVDVSMWVKLATMHFTAAASRWLPSVENKLKNSSWAEFSKLVLDRSGKEHHHELVVRQLL